MKAQACRDTSLPGPQWSLEVKARRAVVGSVLFFANPQISRQVSDPMKGVLQGAVLSYYILFPGRVSPLFCEHVVVHLVGSSGSRRSFRKAVRTWPIVLQGQGCQGVFPRWFVFLLRTVMPKQVRPWSRWASGVSRSCKAHVLQRVQWPKPVRYSAFWEGGAGRIPFISSSLSGPPATFQGEACVPSMRSPKVDSLVPARDACQPIVGHWGWPT